MHPKSPSSKQLYHDMVIQQVNFEWILFNDFSVFHIKKLGL